MARQLAINDLYSYIPDEKTRWVQARQNPQHANLAFTNAEICVGVTPDEAILVSFASHFSRCTQRAPGP